MESFIKSLALKQQIGSGGFGKCFLAQNVDGASYAVKAISKSRGQSHNIAREIQAGKTLQHKNIANFICNFDDEYNEYMVFDLIKGKIAIQFQLLILNRKRFVLVFRKTWIQSIFRIRKQAYL